jgi:hypothetical protein
VLLDPVGYGLGGFDQQGRAQEQAVDGYVIDFASGDEQAFVGPRGLAELLVSNGKTSACTARHWLEYALDREPGEPVLMIPPSGGGDSDEPIGPGGDPRVPTALECISYGFSNDGRNFATLALTIAKAAPFRTITGSPTNWSPTSGSSVTPLDHAIAATFGLQAAYAAEAPRSELDAYLTALRAIADDDAGTGGAGGAGP